MNKKMYITLTSAAGLIVLVSTSALYVLTAWGSADRTVAAASLLFVLLAEIIFFAALVLLEAAGDKLANAAFVWSGQTILTGVYWIFTIIMAVINGYYYSEDSVMRESDYLQLSEMIGYNVDPAGDGFIVLCNGITGDDWEIPNLRSAFDHAL